MAWRVRPRSLARFRLRTRRGPAFFSPGVSRRITLSVCFQERATKMQEILHAPHEQIEQIQLEGIKKTVIQC